MSENDPKQDVGRETAPEPQPEVIAKSSDLTKSSPSTSVGDALKESFVRRLMNPISSQVGIVGVTLLTMAVGTLGILLYAQDLTPVAARNKALGEGILICGAFFCTAAVIGFLFGIPQVERSQAQIPAPRLL